MENKIITITRSNRKVLIELSVVSVIIAIFLILMIFSHVGAQSAIDPYSTPVNISHSGSTSDPRIVLDSEGGIHIVWMDQYAGTTYAYNKDGQWSSPIQVKFPFGSLKPFLYTGSNSLIYALWITDQGGLYFSSVKAAGFGDNKQWEKPLLIADSIANVDMKVDSRGYLYLTYLSKLDVPGYPAGIYYRSSSVNGTLWTLPKQIYQSPYFRSLTTPLSNLQLSKTSGLQAANVFIVWDNPMRKQVFLARSRDDGSSWDKPIEIDNSANTNEMSSPFHIRIGSFNKSVLLIWQNGDPKSTCTQYYQLSTDGGITWSDRAIMLKSLNGCMDDNQIVYASESQYILESKIDNQFYLSVFKENKWSELQSLKVPVTFADPETSSIASLASVQTSFMGGFERMLVVGSDTNNGQNFIPGATSSSNNAGNGDIWFVSRLLGSLDDWFTKPSIWSPPEIAVKAETELTKPYLFSDSNDTIHAFWLQQDIPSDSLQGSNSLTGKVIFYARYIQDNWSAPIRVLVSPVGEIRSPSFAIDSKNRVLAVWIGGDTGDFYFSNAILDQANSPSNWSIPLKLPVQNIVASSPEILVDRLGTYYLVYVIPLNENRGLYILKSKDQGKTWSKPLKVFDGVSAGWEMVDQPRITQIDDGYIHLLWMRSTTPTKSGSLAVYYSHSSDGGDTWSQLEEVVGKHTEWINIIGAAGGKVIRMWQDDSNERSMLWYQYSSDDGITWSSPASLSSFGKWLVSISVAVDNAGRPQLVLLDNSGKEDFSIQHYIWQEQSWLKNEGLPLDIKSIQNISDISAVISGSNNLSVMYAAKVILNKAGDIQNELFFIDRKLEMPLVVPTQAPIISQPLAITATPTSQATPTLVKNLNTSEVNISRIAPDSPPSQWIGFAAGGGLSFIILSIILFFVLRKKKSVLI